VTRNFGISARIDLVMRERPSEPRPATARGPAQLPRGDDGRIRGDAPVPTVAELRGMVNACGRCELWRHSTQGVPGEGPADAELMLVGEAPGDGEDRAGHPFVGPAGAMLERALNEAGIDSESVWLTNAVKHFKFERRGTRRLHVKPTVGEIKACNWWLGEELRLVQPRLVLALGATAARGVLGRTVTVSSLRGQTLPLDERTHVRVTIHPSWLLRIQDEIDRKREYARFVEDLRDSKTWLAQRAADIPSRDVSAP
jgi:DNA polymerase